MRVRAILVAALVLAGTMTRAMAGELPPMTVWKSPYCGCCGNWIERMKAAGFEIEVKETEKLEMVKRMAAIPEPLWSCHTATVGGYRIEGHVPAADIRRLLAIRPKVDGLAVPGMPSGAPGMENGTREPYDVLTFRRGGTTSVFSHHE